MFVAHFRCCCCFAQRAEGKKFYIIQHFIDLRYVHRTNSHTLCVAHHSQYAVYMYAHHHLYMFCYSLESD